MTTWLLYVLTWAALAFMVHWDWMVTALCFKWAELFSVIGKVRQLHRIVLWPLGTFQLLFHLLLTYPYLSHCCPLLSLDCLWHGELVWWLVRERFTLWWASPDSWVVLSPAVPSNVSILVAFEANNIITLSTPFLGWVLGPWLLKVSNWICQFF